MNDDNKVVETGAVSPNEATVAPKPVETPTPPVTTGSPTGAPKPKSQSKLLLMVIAAIFLIGGAAAAYITFVQKSPEKIWESALNNTANGLDKLVELSYLDSQGVTSEGTFSVSEPVVLNGTFSSHTNNDNTKGQYLSSISYSGMNVKAEVRSIANASTTPDIYVKLRGLNGLESLALISDSPYAGAITSLVEEVNEQWYVVDNTLLSGVIGTNEDTSSVTYSAEDIQQIGEKISNVMREGLLSTGEDKVFVIDEKLGNEDFDGLNTYKYKIKIDEDNLSKFMDALADSFKGTVLEDFVSSATQGDEYSESITSGDSDSDLDDFYVHVWVEANGKFIKNIRYYPPGTNNDTNYIDLSLNYTGGDVFPFVLKAVIDENGAKGTIELGFEINQATGDALLNVDINLRSDEVNVVADGNISVKNSSEPIDVEVPVGAKNVIELIPYLYGGGTETTPTIPSSLGVFDELEL